MTLAYLYVFFYLAKNANRPMSIVRVFGTKSGLN